MTTPNPLYWLNILTAGQWNQLFNSKQDALGYVPVNKAGDTMVGRLVTTAPGATTAGLNLTPGSTPSAPVNGDVWVTAAGAFVRVNGVTYQFNRSGNTLQISTLMVNFNALGDTTIPIALPTGSTRYLVQAVRLSNATHSIATATAGVFTGTGGTGSAVVANASAITVSAITDATNNNAQAMTVIDADSRSFLVAGTPNLYFNVANAEGAAATATVTLSLIPLP